MLGTSVGWAFFDWADEWLGDEQRRRLGEVAREEISLLQHLWTAPTSTAEGGRTREGFALSQVHALGWLDTEQYLPLARQTMTEKVVGRLDRYGIRVDRLAELGLSPAA